MKYQRLNNETECQPDKGKQDAVKIALSGEHRCTGQRNGSPTPNRASQTGNDTHMNPHELRTKIYKMLFADLWSTAVSICGVFTWFTIMKFSQETRKIALMFNYIHITVPVAFFVGLSAAAFIAVKNPVWPYKWYLIGTCILTTAALSYVLCCGLMLYTVKTGIISLLFACAVLGLLAWCTHHTKPNPQLAGRLVLACVPLHVMLLTMFSQGAPVLPVLGLAWMVQVGAAILYQLCIQQQSNLGEVTPMVYAHSLYISVVFFYIGSMVGLYDWLH
ncbi:membrane protein A37 [Aotine betaherpesvirus 1]|uniref:Membrane protein A37 n=1 Tax=Aotine betaherpesvirus 1 TaxID=50290 RepID=G8XUL5_9BETA|nr:membrane protein A37 [Aotine betaherpesvirus 1]AEV80857.1 membrane protein A37 [Aotine betaherpesvirus 1]